MGRLLLRPGQDWMRSGNSGPDVSNNGSSCPSIQHPISKVVRFCKCQENPRIQGCCTKTIEGRIPSDCSAEICKKLPRRAILPLIGVTMIFTNVYAVFAAPVKEIKEPEILRILKLASGVRIQDVVEGEGQEAGEGDIVV
ncbi:uncharacterized protein [Primulina eburnea]|uniref:uncharacterized protein n=1 Tax=Primulina eburnea TaxID=1245227 RepID=UPI003C6BF2AB